MKFAIKLFGFILGLAFLNVAALCDRDSANSKKSGIEKTDGVEEEQTPVDVFPAGFSEYWGNLMIPDSYNFHLRPDKSYVFMRCPDGSDLSIKGTLLSSGTWVFDGANIFTLTDSSDASKSWTLVWYGVGTGTLDFSPPYQTPLTPIKSMSRYRDICPQ